MAVSLRPTLLGAVAGAAVLAMIAAVPATAAPAPTVGVGRAAVVGSVPAWASASARIGTLNPNTVRHVEIALTPRDPAGARALATAESTPGNPLYRHRVSAAEYVDRFGPTQSTVDQVEQWLRGQGLRVSGVSANRSLIEASGRVGQLQSAFGVTLSTYHATLHGQRRALVAPDTPVTVPTGLAAQVTAVLGLDDSDATITPAQAHVPVPAVSPAASGTGCATSWAATNNAGVPQKYPDQSNILCGYLTPALRGMYGLSAANTGAGTAVAIVGAYNLASIVADTNRAAADFGSPPLAAGQYQGILPPSFTNNPNCNPDSWNSEQALDVQAIHTEAPAATELYYAATDCTTLVAAFTQAVAADKASVISNSWTYTGESTVPPADRTAFENSAVQAAAQGQTVVFATGDLGDNSTTAGTVETNFPATDPWVSAIGGTTTGLNAAGQHVVLTGWANAGETQNGAAWTPLPATQGGFAGGAGGGRSTLYPQPSYQSSVVPASTANGNRAIPDIAANADPYTGMAIAFTGPNGFVETPFGGTSEATPLIAGIVADAGQIVGQGGFIGFLNPWLYQSGSSALSDVTDHATGIWTPFAPLNGPTAQGSYLVDMGATPQSLTSGTGWDDETGMGTPATGFVAALTAAATG
jgi:subtilase family serine protease